jgi:hypothetical protein
VGQFAEAESGAIEAIEGDGDFVVTGEVGGGRIGGVFEHCGAELALGLEAAEFGEGAAEEVVSLGAGAIDGELEAAGGVIGFHGIEGAGVSGDLGHAGGHAGFNGGAAAEAPGCSDDGFGEGVFEGAIGIQFGVQGGAVCGVLFVFVGTDEVAGGEEAFCGGVAGGSIFAGLGARPPTSCAGLCFRISGIRPGLYPILALVWLAVI